MSDKGKPSISVIPVQSKTLRYSPTTLPMLSDGVSVKYPKALKRQICWTLDTA